MPILIVEDNGAILEPPAVEPEEIELENDGVYLILYTNAQRAVNPGTAVSVSMGEVRLEPIEAQ